MSEIKNRLLEVMEQLQRLIQTMEFQRIYYESQKRHEDAKIIIEQISVVKQIPKDLGKISSPN